MLIIWYIRNEIRVCLLLQVFSSSLYPYFHDDDGNPQTPRDAFGLPRNANNEYVKESEHVVYSNFCVVV